ncbi:hypothetical protein Tco_1251695, partial [Tanacetum coccineum]
RQFIWSRLGDGSRVSAWFDNWCPISPLAQLISSRDIYGAGFQLSSKVNEIIVNGNWAWPKHLYSKFPDLAMFNVPILYPNSVDGIIWINHDNNESGFSVAKVWEHMRSMIGIPNMSSSLDLIVDFLIPLAKKNEMTGYLLRRREVMIRSLMLSSLLFVLSSLHAIIRRRWCSDAVAAVEASQFSYPLFLMIVDHYIIWMKMWLRDDSMHVIGEIAFGCSREEDC